MKVLSAGIFFVITLCAGNGGFAWDATSDFMCASTNALADDSVLMSADFGNALTNYIAIATNHESRIEAQLVLGERYLACYTATMNANDFRNALCVATNICALTCAETNAWYCWQSRLFLFTCFARYKENARAYTVATNALAAIGTRDIASNNIIMAALASRNKTQDLSIRQAVVLANALSAAMLKRRDEAEMLASALPIRYRNMVIRLAISEDWIQ